MAKSRREMFEERNRKLPGEANSGIPHLEAVLDPEEEELNQMMALAARQGILRSGPLEDDSDPEGFDVGDEDDELAREFGVPDSQLLGMVAAIHDDEDAAAEAIRRYKEAQQEMALEDSLQEDNSQTAPHADPGGNPSPDSEESAHAEA